MINKVDYSKMEMIERVEEQPKKLQMYAKTGEIRLRDVDKKLLEKGNRHKRMHSYGRWYMQPELFDIKLKRVMDKV